MPLRHSSAATDWLRCKRDTARRHCSLARPPNLDTLQSEFLNVAYSADHIIRLVPFLHAIESLLLKENDGVRKKVSG